MGPCQQRFFVDIRVYLGTSASSLLAPGMELRMSPFVPVAVLSPLANSLKVNTKSEASKP